MDRRGIAASSVAILLASCATRTPGTELARIRAERLGLEGAERATFAREVTGCIHHEQARGSARGPASSLSVGASGEASGTSVGGLTAVGVMASVLAAGIAYRWWKGIGHQGARPAEPCAAAADTPRPATDAVDLQASGTVAGVAMIDAPDTVVDACLDTVTTRWRAECVPAATLPP